MTVHIFDTKVLGGNYTGFVSDHGTVRGYTIRVREGLYKL